MNNSERILSSQCSFNGIDDDINNCARDKWKKDMASLCGKVFSIFDIARNYRNIVDPQKIYVAKFPPELLEKMQTHDIQFLRDKITDDILPTLYDYTEGGFGGQIRLELKGGITNQDITNLCNSFSNVIEQKKYDNLCEQIQQIYFTVKTIEIGQQNDRYARVLAGKNLLINALSVENDEELKKKLIYESISVLSVGKEMLERSLIEKLNVLTSVPKSMFILRVILFFIGNYDEKKMAAYDEIQNSFKYYCLSVSALSYAYTYLNQPNMIERIIKSCNELLEHRNLSSLSTIEPLLVNFRNCDASSFENTWYSNPKLYEQKLTQAYPLGFVDDNVLSLKISGKDLLEVFSNE